jgi:hypothetical protein
MSRLKEREAGRDRDREKRGRRERERERGQRASKQVLKTVRQMHGISLSLSLSLFPNTNLHV